jgi:hypothetical chaperone protein
MKFNNDADTTIGIDFGTTNTVIAVANASGQFEARTFNCGADTLRVYMSALCFWEETREQGTQVEGGPWAVERFLEGIGTHRFIQSFKTFAASRAFQETWIFRKKFKFEDLLSTFLRTLWRHAGFDLDMRTANVVIGRPVRFAGNKPDEALAMDRYKASFARVGIERAHYVYEPVGAAFFFAQRLEQDATVLVGDFGGGTSDFSVIRFARRNGRLTAEPLGSAGIGIAGDTFDYRIIDKIVSPKLGKGGRYKSFGKVLPMPNGHFANFARWNQLAMMKSSGELKQLIELSRLALDPEPLLKFIEVIEHDLGLALYRAVSSAKAALSSNEHSEFAFRYGDIDIRADISRSDFETWIAGDVKRIAATVDDALTNAGVAASDIDRVFLTGGSSFIPMIQKVFHDRFGHNRIASGDEFESIAYGLALIGRSPSIDDWAVQPS